MPFLAFERNRSTQLLQRQGIASVSLALAPRAIGGQVVSGDHAYFDSLVAHSAALVLEDRDGNPITGSLRSLAEIRSLQAGIQDGLITYSAAEDAAQCEFPSGVVSYFDDQMRVGLPQRYTTGTLLFCWDAKWSSNWNTWEIVEPEAHKEWQLACNASPVDQRRIEIRTLFDQSVVNVGTVDTRSYQWGGGGQPIQGSGNDPDTIFEIVGDRWCRYWAFIDFDLLRYTLWVGDEQRAPARVYDQFQFTDMTGALAGLDGFWFEHNTSQGRTGGDSLFIWERNLAVLRDQTLAEAQAIVDLGDQTV